MNVSSIKDSSLKAILTESGVKVLTAQAVGRTANTIIRKLMRKSVRNGAPISDIHESIQRALINQFQEISVVGNDAEVRSLKCVPANQERAIASKFPENNLILPILSIDRIDTSPDTAKARYKPQVVYDTIWDEDEQRAKRIVSLVPKASIFTYVLRSWTQYAQDQDQITEQINLLFQPDVELETRFTDSLKVFLEGESDQSNVELEDTDVRMIMKEYTLTVETYIPSPKFLFTNTGKIERFNIDTCIVRPEVTPDDTSDTPTSSVEVPETYTLTLSALAPTYGPWWLPQVYAVFGSGMSLGSPGALEASTGGIAAISTEVLSDDLALIQRAAFSSSSLAGSAVGVTVSNSNGSAILTQAFTISELPTISNIISTVVDNENRIEVVGDNFDSYFAPWFTGPNFRNTEIIIGTSSLTTVINSDTSISAITPSGFDGQTFDVTVSSFNGSSTETDGYTFPTSFVPSESPAPAADMIVTWVSDPDDPVNDGGLGEVSSIVLSPVTVTYPITYALEQAASEVQASSGKDYVIQVGPGIFAGSHIGGSNTNSKYQAHFDPSANQDGFFQLLPDVTINLSGVNNPHNGTGITYLSGAPSFSGPFGISDRALEIDECSGLSFTNLYMAGGIGPYASGNEFATQVPGKFVVAVGSPSNKVDASGNPIDGTIQLCDRITFTDCVIDGNFDFQTWTGMHNKWCMISHGASNLTLERVLLKNSYKEHGFYEHNSQGPINVLDSSAIYCGGNAIQSRSPLEENNKILPAGEGDFTISNFTVSECGHVGQGFDGNSGGIITISGARKDNIYIYDVTINTGADTVLTQAARDNLSQLLAGPDPDTWILGARQIAIRSLGQDVTQIGETWSAGKLCVVSGCTFNQAIDTGYTVIAGFDSVSSLHLSSNTVLAGGALAGATSGNSLGFLINDGSNNVDYLDTPLSAIQSGGNTTSGTWRVFGSDITDINDVAGWPAS